MTKLEAIIYLIKHHNMKRIQSKRRKSNLNEKFYIELMQALQNIKNELEISDMLKPFLKETLSINEYGSRKEMRFKPICFGFAKIMDIDGNFHDTKSIEKCRKIKDWIEEEEQE